MALQLSYAAGTGIVHSAAYGRIQKVIIDNPVSSSKSVCFDLCIFASSQARTDGKSPVWGPQVFQVQQPSQADPEQMECAVDPTTVTMADCYTWLKTQPNFTEATDV